MVWLGIRSRFGLELTNETHKHQLGTNKPTPKGKEREREGRRISRSAFMRLLRVEERSAADLLRGRYHSLRIQSISNKISANEQRGERVNVCECNTLIQVSSRSTMLPHPSLSRRWVTLWPYSPYSHSNVHHNIHHFISKNRGRD